MVSTIHVTVDDQVFLLQPRGGISRYFTEVLRQFSSDATLGVSAEVAARWVRNEHLVEAFPGQYRVPSPWLRRRPLMQFANRTQRPGSRPDVVHHTHYGAEALSRFPGIPRICTIYDMIPELMPQEFPDGNPHMLKKRYVEECDAIICISETTRRDLLATYDVGDKPVEVTHLAVSDHFRPSGGPQPKLPDRYVLFIGHRGGYKNADILMRAMSGVAQQNSDVWTVLVGGGALTTAESARAESLGIGDRVLQIDPPDQDLPDVYAKSAAFVFPSRYEGFGLPVLEALAAGTPALLANTAIFREVAGTAGVYFDPDDDQQLASLIDTCLTDRDNRQRLASAGRRRLEEFSWHRTAQQTAQVYRQLLSGSGKG